MPAKRQEIPMPRFLALACCLMLCLTNLGAGAAEQSPSEVSAVTVPPGQVNRAVNALDSLAQTLLRKTGVPGMSVAVVRNDKVVYLKGFGLRKIGSKERVDPDTVFEIASVSKPVGATVIAALVGRGTVKWSDAVSKYLPGFTLSNPYVGRTVTIADMYAHRSGLPDHAGDLLEDLGYDRAAIIQRLAQEPLSPFRISYAYTNFGLTAAAEAAADAAKTDWATLSDDLLYRPLGMRSTSSRFADYERASDKATLHTRINGRWIAGNVRDADAQSPAGGVSTSARDMAQWLRLQLANGRYNSRQIVDERALMETRIPSSVSGPPASPTARASFYGLGMNVSYDAAGRVHLSHSGGFNSGAATTVMMLPSEHLGIVVLTNGMPIGAAEALAQEFLDLAEFGHVERDWLSAYWSRFSGLYHNPSMLSGKQAPTNPTPALAATAYAGTYANSFYGPAQIQNRDGKLVMLLGPNKQTFALTHWEGNTFAYYPTGENAVGISSVTFSVSANHAQSLVVEYLNAEKLGTFTLSS
jgi:CubicO group peptidase (beta-lactamase class C family)